MKKVIISLMLIIVVVVPTMSQECPDKQLPRAQRLQYDFDFEAQLPFLKAKPLLVQKYSEDGHDYAVVYASGDFWGEKCIENVYVFDKGEPLLELKEVDAFVDHNTGPNTEFAGILITRRTYDSNWNQKGVIEKELRIPEEVQNTLIKLLLNELEWENKTNIGYVETKDAILFPTRIRAIY